MWGWGKVRGGRQACSTRSEEGVSASSPLSAACSLLARPNVEKATKTATYPSSCLYLDAAMVRVRVRVRVRVMARTRVGARVRFSGQGQWFFAFLAWLFAFLQFVSPEVDRSVSQSLVSK